jgi:hypothetical protein
LGTGGRCGKRGNNAKSPIAASHRGRLMVRPRALGLPVEWRVQGLWEARRAAASISLAEVALDDEHRLTDHRIAGAAEDISCGS